MTGVMLIRWFVACALGLALPCQADIFVRYASDGTPSYSTTPFSRSQIPLLRDRSGAKNRDPAATETGSTARLEELAPIINAISARHTVDPALIKAVIEVESRFRPTVQSPKGAMGLMQLMPATARQYGITAPFDPPQNIEAGVRHLKALIIQYNGNLALALAAYNAGAQSVVRSGKRIPPYRETMDYVPTVLARYAFYRREGGE
ncbi:lytic transglycosylase domain-containing protein [Cupriavidus sp. H39]|uniref:lytic transglycosylase domain-containing protein n=1 Tax=Cupriavidus sp. H39 TaxID=3401635 RepID=UPI003D000376